ncbi:hypothetical protein HY389_02330 [Candidatus Daviesbacteria bacterium]|nr:hypothetical protein [Candidatus Daviesbacteria bacterium]
MNLTQTAKLTKRGLIVLAALIFLGITGKVGYQIWYTNFYLPSLPPKIELPENKFGVLPPVNFPKSDLKSSNYTYSIDTATGGLPQTPKLVKVYFLPQAGVSLLAPDRSKDLATKLGFSNGPQILSQTQYKFSDDSGGNLTIDLNTGNFSFERPIASASADLQNNTLPDPPQLIANFKNYLQGKNLLPDGLKDGRSQVNYNGNSQSDAQTASVTLWPADIDKLPIITPAQQGLITVTVTKARDETKKFVKLNYTYWPVDKTTSSTYSIKTAQRAFDELKTGSAYMIKQPPKNQVSISSVYLAYFESADYPIYLQPVFVFEGPDFMAIIPAVTAS